MGDGTTSVVIIASELLKRANQLIKQKLHPTSIMSGYKIACKEACSYITENLCVKVKDLGTDCLVNCAKTSMSSKIIGAENEFYSKMVVEAIQFVKTGDKYPVKAVNIVKNHGGNTQESELYKGSTYMQRLHPQDDARQPADAHLRGQRQDRLSRLQPQQVPHEDGRAGARRRPKKSGKNQIKVRQIF